MTLQNIRLWDHRPLLRTYSQLQVIRSYYDFVDVDNDLTSPGLGTITSAADPRVIQFGLKLYF